MPDEPELHEDTTRDAIGDLRGWRFESAMRLGMTPKQAKAVAADEALDLHALGGLIARGCPHALALKIPS